MYRKVIALAKISDHRDLTLSGRLRRLTTFSPEVHEIVRTMNELLALDIKDIHFFFEGHVRGFKELVYEKPLDMALLYVAIRSHDRDLRLRALKRLKQEADNYHSKEMPLNTPPVLMALMKECVKAKGNEHLQCQYVDCYIRALSGKAPAVRRALGLLGMAEIQEKEGRTAWDHHVSIDRKKPAQLVLDAYIKGLSDITIVFESLSDTAYRDEVLLAGQILGITVNCALEYIVRSRSCHFHQTVIFENCRTPEDFDIVLESTAWKRFHESLRNNDAVRNDLFLKVIERFNSESLPRLKSQLGYGDIDIPPLMIDDLKAYAQGKSLYQIHLGRYLFNHLRALFIKQERPLPSFVDKVYLREKYFDAIYYDLMGNTEFMPAGRAFDLLSQVKSVSVEGLPIQARIVFNRPVIHGLEKSLEFITDHHDHIAAVEVWNNRISGPAQTMQMLLLNRIREHLNTGHVDKALTVVQEYKIGILRHQLQRAAVRFMQEPLKARIGSNSDGHNHKVPGMGFAIRYAVRRWRKLLKNNAVKRIGLLVRHRAEIHDQVGITSVKTSSRKGGVIPLGKSEKAKGRFLPENRRTDRFSLMREYVRDLNMHIKDVALMGLGAAASYSVYCLNAAFSFNESIHAFWFFITYGRNMHVDLVSKNGWNPINWRLKDFDPHNAAVSMFFSFLSIPMLRIADQYFQMAVLTSSGSALDQSVDQMIVYISGYHDQLAAYLRANQEAAVSTAKRFLNYMSLASLNGAYIYGHNTLRGFTREVKRRNLMRSFIAGPIAFGLSYLFGWAGIAISVVLLGKIASEMVGGYIEGTIKSKKEYELNYTTLEEIVPETQLEGVDAATAQRKMTGVLDIIDILWDNPRSRIALKKILEQGSASIKDLTIFLEPYHMRNKYESYISDQLPIRKTHKVLSIFQRVIHVYGPWMERVVAGLSKEPVQKKWYSIRRRHNRAGK